MPAEPPSDERQAVLAKVKRLRQEYLKATREFERVLRLILTRNGHSKALTNLMDAAKACKLAFSRYVAAAAEAAGPELPGPDVNAVSG